MWRQALTGLDSVGGISGWLHSPTEQSEADLVDRISVDVLNKLNPRARELPSIRVGMEAAVRDLVASAHLQQDQQVRLLGLADEGIALLRHRLGGHKVLLVLDDVAPQSGPDSPDVVNALLVSESLPSGSHVVITSRDKSMLKRAGCTQVVDIRLLDKGQARRLFWMHAFPTATEPSGLAKIVSSAVEACTGLPLTLKVMGAFLRDKSSTDAWQQAVQRLQDARPIPGVVDGDVLRDCVSAMMH
ncbi:hypothetical protein WJX72_002727 [[Myrmecia] bisecta]|uniref:NB-ARC domain-containing protein n=1 Tax=[Myrmecia] bisecta TaxID=41462 RepID=A0AAW1PSJ8_9CHLO